MKITLPALGRTIQVAPGSNRVFDKLPKTETGEWPLVITFDRKIDRDNAARSLRQERV